MAVSVKTLIARMRLRLMRKPPVQPTPTCHKVNQRWPFLYTDRIVNSLFRAPLLQKCLLLSAGGAALLELGAAPASPINNFEPQRPFLLPKDGVCCGRKRHAARPPSRGRKPHPCRGTRSAPLSGAGLTDGVDEICPVVSAWLSWLRPSDRCSSASPKGEAKAGGGKIRIWPERNALL